MNKELTLLTTSCKYYEDVLDIHETLYKIHWADCPFKRYLVMEEELDNKNILNNYDKVIITGKESGKKNHLRITQALEQIDTPYVAFFQEDMLLCNKVNSADIISLLNFAIKHKAGVMRLLPVTTQYTQIFSEKDNLVEYPKGTPYRISYAPAIWEKNFLYNISKEFVYGGDFERKGTFMALDMPEKVLGVKYAVYPYLNGILRGKWELPAVRYLNYYKIIPDFNRHSLMTPKDLLKQAIMGYIYNINPTAILKLQNTVKLGKSY